MNAALAVLSNTLNAKTATALPSCSTPTSLTLDGGTATYCGTLDTSTYVWSLTSTGTAPNPTGGSPLTQTLHRTVTVQGISDGADVSAWSRFYQDSPTQCLTLDTVRSPVRWRPEIASSCRTAPRSPAAPRRWTSTGTSRSRAQPARRAPEQPRRAPAGRTPPTSSPATTPTPPRAIAGAARARTSMRRTSASAFRRERVTITTASSARNDSRGRRDPRPATPPPSAGTITYDTASSATSAIVGADARVVAHGREPVEPRARGRRQRRVQLANSCQASSVTYGGQAHDEDRTGRRRSGTYECTSLWYLLAPTAGTNTITVTYQSPITDRTAGAVGLYNVKQAAPDASNTNSNSSGAATTSVHHRRRQLLGRRRVRQRPGPRQSRPRRRPDLTRGPVTRAARTPSGMSTKSSPPPARPA